MLWGSLLPRIHGDQDPVPKTKNKKSTFREMFGDAVIDGLERVAQNVVLLVLLFDSINISSSVQGFQI